MFFTSCSVELASHLVEDNARHTDPARLGDRLEPGRDIDTVAVDIAMLDDDVAKVDADSEPDRLFVSEFRIAFGEGLLDCDRALNRINRAGEFDERTVAHQFCDPAMVARDSGFDDRLAELDQRSERSGLVLAHEATVADDIECHHCGKSAPYAIRCHRGPSYLPPQV
jgi:hypothetical protein